MIHVRHDYRLPVPMMLVHDDDVIVMVKNPSRLARMLPAVKEEMENDLWAHFGELQPVVAAVPSRRLRAV